MVWWSCDNIANDRCFHSEASFYRFDGILHIRWALNDSDTTRLLSLFALFEASCSWHDSRLCIFTAHVLKSVWFSLSQEPSASKLFCWNFKWWRLMRKKKIPPFQILFNEPVDLFQPGFLLLANFQMHFCSTWSNGAQTETPFGILKYNRQWERQYPDLIGGVSTKWYQDSILLSLDFVKKQH